MGRYDDIDPMDIDPETNRPYSNYSSPSLDTSFHDWEMAGEDEPETRRRINVIGGCGHTITYPEWNPYDGIWECECGHNISDVIPGGPRDADFAYYNQNPDI